MIRIFGWCQRMNTFAHVNSGKTIRHIAHTHTHFFVTAHSWKSLKTNHRINQTVEDNKKYFPNEVANNNGRIWNTLVYILLWYSSTDKNTSPLKFCALRNYFENAQRPRKTKQNKNEKRNKVHAKRTSFARVCIVGASVRYLSLSWAASLFLSVFLVFVSRVSKIQCSNIHRQMRIILHDCKVSWLMLFSFSVISVLLRFHMDVSLLFSFFFLCFCSWQFE